MSNVQNMEPLALDVATVSETDEILQLIVALSGWLKTKGILQWSQSYPREKIASDIRSGFVYVLREHGQIAATVTLSTHKDVYWNDFPGEAIYLHRLAVRRTYAGQRLGSRILVWSEVKVKARGASLLRLDCDSQNLQLRQYYMNHGFTFCALRRFEEYNMEFALFEKPLNGRRGIRSSLPRRLT